jgi:hypothetical protein
MKIYVEIDGKQEKVDPRSIKIGDTNLEQMFARIIKLEKDYNKLIEDKKEELNQTKSFFAKRL